MSSRDRTGTPAETAERVRALAFYLPQFHPIPENDEWWGQGFTDWVNVASARPLFRSHYQPHVPRDLGFYDLRFAAAREAQAELAAAYGIFGFCYYHYWFNGRRLLEQPFDEVLRSGSPSLPFCLCWANERWTRTWDGLSSEPLIEQTYSEADDIAHIRSLLPAFDDHRYVRVDGKPLFLVYRASNLPDPLRTTTTWREEAARAGLGDLFLARVESFCDERGDPAQLGFDAGVEFQPDRQHLPRPLQSSLPARLRRRVRLSPRNFDDWFVYEYEALVQQALARSEPDYRWFRCATPQWDNSPRRPGGGGWIFHGSTPAAYARWLEELARREERRSGDRLIFINAWNEWGEGSHVEPCQRWGRAYLEATQRVLGAPVPRRAESTP